MSDLFKNGIILFATINVVHVVVEGIYSLINNASFEYSLRDLIIYLAISVTYAMFNR